MVHAQSSSAECSKKEEVSVGYENACSGQTQKGRLGEKSKVGNEENNHEKYEQATTNEKAVYSSCPHSVRDGCGGQSLVNIIPRLMTGISRVVKRKSSLAQA